MSMPRVRSGRGRGFGQVLHGRPDTARLMGDVGDPKPHFDTAQRSGKHQVVEVAEMADPEDPAGEARQAVAERHVEMFRTVARKVSASWLPAS